MLAQVTRLRYWKSEHDEQTCEDALGEHVPEGLFVVADGVGTTLFSNVWAWLLVDHFLNVPLLSNDPFEVEWWLRLIQERYQQELPSLEGMPWNALQKAQSQGSYSTLATVRITRVDADSALVTLLVFGDSCILIKKADTNGVLSFPLEKALDFDQAPISLPSKLSSFNRYFHRCTIKHVELAPGDNVILATDAVARWIVSAGNGRYADSQSAFLEVAAQTPDSWSAFITGCRARNEMIDDDSTALVVALQPDALNTGMQLGSTSEHSTDVREKRKHTFTEALQAQNKELVAISFGDGIDLGLEGVSFPSDQLQQARAVADALRDMLQVLRREVNSLNPVETLGPAWQRYAPLLQDEPCAAKLRQTLTRLGVPLAPSLTDAPTTSDAASSLIEARQQEDTGRQQDAGTIDMREMLRRRREQLDLERRLMQALRSEDDKAIILAYDNIRQSPYMQDFTFSLRREQRVLLAQQRETERRRLRRALKSKNAEQIANAYESVSRNASLLSGDERKQVLLASRFIEAYRSENDEVLLATSEKIRSAAYHEAIVFTLQEKERLARARRRAMMRTRTIPTTTGTSAISEVWFRKMCSVKRAYLLYWASRQVTPEQLERMTLDDLADDPLIQKGIEEANRNAASPTLLLNNLLPELFRAFKNDSDVAYDGLLKKNRLTDDEVKTILLIFLRRQLFEEYLLWQQAIQLQDWLKAHDSERTAFRQNLVTACPWIPTLNWWKGQYDA